MTATEVPQPAGQGAAQAPPPARDRVGQARELPPFSHVYPARAGSVPLARRAIAEFAAKAGARGELLDAVRLAASEALTNAVQYAYADSNEHIEVNAWLAEQDLWLLITDEGCGLRAGRPSNGLGQGLVLIELVADEVWIVDRSLGGTEVRTRFRLARTDG